MSQPVIRERRYFAAGVMQFNLVIYKRADGFRREQRSKLGSWHLAIPIFPPFFKTHIQFARWSVIPHRAHC